MNMECIKLYCVKSLFKHTIIFVCYAVTLKSTQKMEIVATPCIIYEVNVFENYVMLSVVTQINNFAQLFCSNWLMGM